MKKGARCPEHPEAKPMWCWRTETRYGPPYRRRRYYCKYCNSLNNLAWRLKGNAQRCRDNAARWYWANRERKLAYMALLWREKKAQRASAAA